MSELTLKVYEFTARDAARMRSEVWREIIAEIFYTTYKPNYLLARNAWLKNA
jgi:hypothetical protein